MDAALLQFLIKFLVFIVAQVFGLCPVSGVLQSNVRYVKYKWCSIKVFWFAGILIASFSTTCLVIVHAFSLKLNIGSSGLKR